MIPKPVTAFSICMLMSLLVTAQGFRRDYKDVPLSVFLNDLRNNPAYKLVFWPDEMKYTIINVRVDVSDGYFQMLEKALRDLPFTYKVQPNKVGPPSVLILHKSTSLTVRVVDERFEPQPNVMVTVLQTQKMMTTDVFGIAGISGVADSAILEVSGINIVPRVLRTNGHNNMEIRVQRKTKNLDSITVSTRRPNDGFEPLSVATSTVSFSHVDSEMLNRPIATNVVDHFARQTGGLQSDPGTGNSLGLSIRGRNTLYSFNNPLLVRKNFPYPGNTGDINPYDIAGVTILKDAAANSIWGNRSGNGVIVLTSPEGTYSKKLQWTFTMNTTIAQRPDLSYLPRMSPTSFIGAEWTLFTNTAFQSSLYNPNFAVTPSVRVYSEWLKNHVTSADAQIQKTELESHSTLSDLRRYFYRASFNQQYHVSIDGGGCSEKYYASFGYDHDPTPLVRNGYQRFTVHGSFTSHPLTPHLETLVLLNFSAIKQENNNDGTVGANYPYARVADVRGNPLAVSHKYNPDFIDTAGRGQLLNWDYRPLQELQLSDNRTRRYVLDLQTNLTWHLNPAFSAAVFYRQFNSWSSNKILYDKESFYVRDRVNQFTDLNNANPYSRVPFGNIFFASDTASAGHNIRTQFSFATPPHHRDQWMALAGGELSDLGTTGQSQTIYGYDGHGRSALMDLVNLYPTLTTGLQRIPGSNDMPGLANRYIALFSNLSYTHKDLYTLSGTFRRDASNFVGIDASHRWASFWSLSASRQLLPVADVSDTAGKYAPSLKARASYGCNGNISNRTAYLTTQALGTNNYGLVQSGIASPPDPSLTWERTYIENAGFDFVFFRDKLSPQGRLYGSVDVYWKQARDLLGLDSLPLSAGYSIFLGNTAGINGNGIELALNSENSRGRVRWSTGVLLNVVKDRVSKYRFRPVSPVSYVSNNYPMVGKSPAGLYSYRWGGLEAATGNPQGYLNGQLSQQYSQLMNDPGGSYHYSGSYQPVVFGSILNTVTFKKISFSASLTYKGGYRFRRSSINYNDIAQELTAGHKDYDKRWITAGDEKHSSVPSVPATPDPNRDAFYLNSDVLITRADHLRWQDCQLSYTREHTTSKKKLFFKQAVFYLYVDNPGIIWKANHYGIDPDAAHYGDLPAVRTWSVGCRVSF